MRPSEGHVAGSIPAGRANARRADPGGGALWQGLMRLVEAQDCLPPGQALGRPQPLTIVVVREDCQIGERVILQNGVVIGSDGFGYVWDGSKHVKIPQLGTVEIEDEVDIGANVTIDRASLGKTIIGKGTKIDNLVQIAHNVTVGENSIIVAQVGIAGSATIGNNVILAGQTGVRDHVTVGNNVKAGGRTGITKDVPDNTLIMGTPHMPFKEWAKLQGYFSLLPKLFAKVKNMEKKLLGETNDD